MTNEAQKFIDCLKDADQLLEDYPSVGFSGADHSINHPSLKTFDLTLFEEWYGRGFFEVSPNDSKRAFVKVDGNRRISIYKDHVEEGTVWALYTDLSKEEEVKALTAKE